MLTRMKHGSVRKFFRRLALLIGALVAALAVFILEENIRGRILLSRYKTELRAKGEKLTLAELDLAPLHAESNDVAILVATGVDLLPFGNPRPDNAILPASITPILARVEPLTHSDKPLLAVDYESYPRVRNFEEVKALFGVAGWLSVAALDAARRGDRIGAVERVSEIISFGKRLRHERVQTSQHDRVNLLIRALDVSWRLLQTNGWIDDELARFQQVWSEPFPLDDVLDIDEVERAMQLRVVDRRQASISE